MKSYKQLVFLPLLIFGFLLSALPVFALSSNFYTEANVYYQQVCTAKNVAQLPVVAFGCYTFDKVNELNTTVTNIQTTLSTLTGNVTSLQTQVNNLQTQVNSLNQTVINLESALTPTPILTPILTPTPTTTCVPTCPGGTTAGQGNPPGWSGTPTNCTTEYPNNVGTYCNNNCTVLPSC